MTTNMQLPWDTLQAVHKPVHRAVEKHQHLVGDAFLDRVVYEAVVHIVVQAGYRAIHEDPPCSGLESYLESIGPCAKP